MCEIKSRQNNFEDEYFETAQENDCIFLRKKFIDNRHDQIIFATGYCGTLAIPTRLSPDAATDTPYEGWFMIERIVPCGGKHRKVFLKSCNGAGEDLPVTGFRDGQWVSGVVSDTEGNCIKVELAPNRYGYLGKNKFIENAATGDLCIFRILQTDSPQGVIGDRLFLNTVVTPRVGTMPIQNNGARQTALPEKFEGHFNFGKCVEELVNSECAFKKEFDPATGNVGYRSIGFEEFKATIAKDYELAVKENKVLVGPSDWTFQTSLVGPDEGIGPAPIFIGFRKGHMFSSSEPQYHINFSGYKAKGIYQLEERDIYCDNWNGMIEELANIALPEDWSKSGKRPYDMLSSYLAFTYYCAMIQDKVMRSPRQLVYDKCKRYMMVFNTGLVNIYYKPIYACMFSLNKSEKSALKITQDYRLYGFATPGQGELGKMITSYFDTACLPRRVEYIRNTSEILLDPYKEIILDEEHIVIDNISRLPMGFLIDSCHSDNDCVKLITEAYDKGHNYNKEKELKKYLLEKNPMLIRIMTGRINDAVKTAILRVKWNYKTAVATYYPARNKLSLLLPLCLTPTSKDGSMKADVALVISKRPSGSYQGETILTLSMAYENSRLITRPDSDWLTASTCTSAA